MKTQMNRQVIIVMSGPAKQVFARLRKFKNIHGSFYKK